MLEAYRAQRIGRAGVEGGLAILDQTIFSGSNFAFTVLLARWLSPVQYGAYSLAFACLLVLYQLHQSLITDPMGVLGPANYHDRLLPYLVAELKMHFALSVPLALALSLAPLVLALTAEGDLALLGQNLALMSVVVPLALLPWFLRRAFYVLRRPAVSALGSSVYGVSLMAVLFLLHGWRLLGSLTAIASFAVAGLLGGVPMLAYLLLPGAGRGSPALRPLLCENWLYARWLVAAGVLLVVAGQMQVFVAGRVLGISAAGIVDVLQSFSQPMILIIGAISAITTPALALDFSRARLRAMQGKVALVTVGMFASAAVFEGALLLLGGQLEQLLYGGKFSAYVELIPVFGIVPILLALYWGPAIGLQAAKRPQDILVVSCAWAPASLILTYVLTSNFGLPGAAWSAVLGYLVIVGACWVLYAAWKRRSDDAV